MDSILVIDDDPGFRKLLETILSKEGYQVQSGSTVAEALRLGRAREFDLVISHGNFPYHDVVIGCAPIMSRPCNPCSAVLSLEQPGFCLTGKSCRGFKDLLFNQLAGTIKQNQAHLVDTG